MEECQCSTREKSCHACAETQKGLDIFEGFGATSVNQRQQAVGIDGRRSEERMKGHEGGRPEKTRYFNCKTWATLGPFEFTSFSPVAPIFVRIWIAIPCRPLGGAADLRWSDGGGACLGATHEINT